jgi:hypothetical protein
MAPTRATLAKVAQSAVAFPLAYFLGVGRGYDSSQSLVLATAACVVGAAIALAAVHGLRFWWHDFGEGTPGPIRLRLTWSVVVSTAAAVAAVIAITVISSGPSKL